MREGLCEPRRGGEQSGGLHSHFFQTSPALKFDRGTKGFRLDIPAGTATRFEPGQSTVRLVALASEHEVCQEVTGKV